MAYYTLKVCANRGAFEAIPSAPERLDLGRVRQSLESNGVSVLDCRVMLIARLERELTIGQDGRLLIKTTDGAEAERILRRFEGMVAAGGLP